MDKTKTEQLRKLLADATPGPWHEVSAFAAHDTVYPSINGDYITPLDSKLICFLRNNAALLLELVEAKEKSGHDSDCPKYNGMDFCACGYDELYAALKACEEESEGGGR